MTLPDVLLSTLPSLRVFSNMEQLLTVFSFFHLNLFFLTMQTTPSVP